MDPATQTAAAPDPAHAPSASDEPHHIKLACQACQRKKIKCDRSYPCGQCHRSALQCVPSTRKPRARHVGKRAVDSELRSRITKLESLVESLSGEVALPSDSPTGSNNTERHGSTDASSPTASKFVASSFWASLSTEVQGLRDALEDEQHASDGEGHATDAMGPSMPPVPDSTDIQQDYDLLLCPPGAVYVMPGALSEPDAAMAQDLFDIYFENIEPVFKVFHRPTLQAFLLREQPYLGHDANAPCNKALKAATWFAAICSITEHECQQRFGLSRTLLTKQYKRLVEISLAQADLVNTTQLATLQALITYLASARLIDMSRRSWTLLGLLVRIAHAMNLHVDVSGESVYVAELNARMWHHIYVLDAFCAVDRGSEPMISFDSHSRLAPSDVNDDDFDEHSTSLSPRAEGVTDMTFARLAQEGSIVMQRLNMPDDKPSSDTWQHRQELAKAFEQDCHERYLQYCDPNIPFHSFILAVGKSCIASTWLRAIRPIHRNISSVPPRVDSPYVLRLAVNNLRAGDDLYTNEALRKWQWMIWVQWHALAVTLAGLCSIRDTALAEEAWALAERAMVRYSKHVADTKTGMLWRPIVRLYRKAADFKASGQSAKDTPPSVLTSPSSQQSYQQHVPSFVDYTPKMDAMLPPDMDNGSTQPSWNMSTSAPTANMMQQPQLASGMDMDATNITFNMSAGALPPLPITDNSWLDWEGMMKDLDDINVGGMNWMPQWAW